MTDRTLTIGPDSPSAPDVTALLLEHLADMHATSPPESVHALDVSALEAPEISFVTVRAADGSLLACGALADLGDGAGELKSMRTRDAARGRGVGAALLRHLVDLAVDRGHRAIYLETGTPEEFAPARRLYERAGFVETEPFGSYELDPYSVFMVLRLAPHAQS
ncbi:GNAT family N-acetyltransferase [Marisediminicola sp. LYQ85]|uniref:GNAT family N-acetyltransferase n=1 Tax=Marisediminicola sp. LYQ85 TaxID=3391062 RepID=UPI003983D3F0